MRPVTPFMMMPTLVTVIPGPSAAALATLSGGAPSAAARWRSRRELVRGMVAQAS